MVTIRQEDVPGMIKRLQEEENFDRLSQWEQGFVMSLVDQQDKGRTVWTDGQMEKLEQVWQKIP